VIEAKVEEPKRLNRFPYNVLVAENNPVNQEVVKAMLQSCGCRVDVVENGQEVIAAVADTPYALVFMDCMMPVLDGFEATKAIRTLENQDDSRARVPIVALTAHTMKGDREMCLAAGMDDYLSKPFTKEQLQEILGKWLQAQPAPEPVTPESCPEASGSGEVPGVPPPPPGGNHARPGSAASSADQPLDGHILSQIRSLQQDGAPNLLNKVIQTYLSETPNLLDRLFNAVEQENAHETYKAAHTLKSSSAHIGALPLAEFFKKLEALAQEKALGQAKPLIAQISSEYDRVRNALQLEMSG
jgi:two-component system, sensor histidine kinase and response regulator